MKFCIKDIFSKCDQSLKQFENQEECSSIVQESFLDWLASKKTDLHSLFASI